MSVLTRDNYTYEEMKDIAEFLNARTNIKPKFGVICGSGLREQMNALTNVFAIDYKDIPNFPTSTVEGQTGRMLFGHLYDIGIVVMQGRFHYYQGYPLPKCSMPVCVMKLLGVEYLMTTNAAGGINLNYKPGDIMIIRDHINLVGLAGSSPLRGPNLQELGPRFPPMANCYDPELIRLGRQVATEMNITSHLHEGIYTAVGGPSYETIAELRLIRCLGGDAVGMSTANEVITARHCGITVFAFSLISNRCPLDYETESAISHEEVLAIGRERAGVCAEFLTRVIHKIIEVKQIQPTPYQPLSRSNSCQFDHMISE